MTSPLALTGESWLGHSAGHSARHHTTSQDRLSWTMHPTRPARTALCGTAWTVVGRLLIRRLQVRVLPGAQKLQVRGLKLAEGNDLLAPVAIPSLKRVALRALLDTVLGRLREHGPSGSRAARSQGALRAIDSSARPRSWRTCGPRRLRRQSQPALVATQGDTARLPLDATSQKLNPRSSLCCP